MHNVNTRTTTSDITYENNDIGYHIREQRHRISHTRTTTSDITYENNDIGYHIREQRHRISHTRTTTSDTFIKRNTETSYTHIYDTFSYFCFHSIGDKNIHNT